MPLDHLNILAHFNHARSELMAAEKLLDEMAKNPDNRSRHFRSRLSREVFIEIRRIEYLIRQEMTHREDDRPESGA